MDIANAIDPSCKIKNIGIRMGEKLHEDLITETESPNTLELDDKVMNYIISRKYHGIS